VPFEAADLPAGVYFYWLEAHGQVRTGAVQVVR
jgi:hypothetical protein